MIRSKSLALAMYAGAALAGAAVALAAERMTGQRSAPAAQQSGRVRFFDQLRLTPAQRESASVLMDERDRRLRANVERFKAALDPFQAAQDSVFDEYRQRLSLLLTAEQKATYDSMRHAQTQRERAARGERGEKKQ
jgi:hypothetical protein